MRWISQFPQDASSRRAALSHQHLRDLQPHQRPHLRENPTRRVPTLRGGEPGASAPPAQPQRKARRTAGNVRLQRQDPSPQSG